MDLRKFCLQHNVRITPKTELLLMRWAGKLLGERFMTIYWTTYRLPFGKGIIAYPSNANDPMDKRWKDVIDHELIHIEQQRSAWGLFKSFLFYFLIPLPILFSGRWFIEREPYSKVDIARGRKTPQSAANQLWSDYGKPWPRKWMADWFEQRRNF